MCKIFNTFESDIRKYCVDNKLSENKVFSFAKCYNDEIVFIQFYDPEKGKRGLLDETPAPVVLKIFKKGDKIEFEQTEYTQRYLAQ